MITAAAVRPRTSANDAERSVELVFSTGSDVVRGGAGPDGLARGRWIERLSLGGARVETGTPVVLDHNLAVENIVATVESVRRERAGLVAKVRFGRGLRADSIFESVKDSIVRSVSVGYVVRSWARLPDEDGTRVYRADDWQVAEISLVVLPADAGARVRSDETTSQLTYREAEMALATSDRADESAATRAGIPGTAPVVDATRDDAADLSTRVRELERARVATIVRVARDLNLSSVADRAVIDELVDSGVELTAARAQLINLAAARSAETGNRPRIGDGTSYGTGPAGTRDAIARGLAHRMLPAVQADAASQPYSRMSLAELERAYNAAGGEGRYMARAGFGMETVSDLAHLVGDATRMVLATAYEIARPALLPAARLVQVSDLQPATVIRPTVGPGLLEVGEHGEIKQGPVESGYEVVQAKTFARDLAFTRQLVMADRVGALADFATVSARAASQTLGGLLTTALTANPVMSDGSPFFSAAHANVAASGTILSLAALEAAMIAVRSQTDDGGNIVGVVPKWLVVGPRREVQAKQLVAQLAAVEAANHNPYAGDLQVIVEPRLTGFEWFVLGDTNINPALAFVTLDGSRRWSTLNGVPVVEVDEHPNALGLRVRIYADFNAQPLDWRAAYRNAGSAS